MKISQLPEPFKSLAIKRREEYGFPHSENQDVLWCAFNWKRTPEGAAFWDMVDEKRYKTEVVRNRIQALRESGEIQCNWMMISR